MNIAIIALGLFLDRAAAGFPLIKKWFSAIKTDTQKSLAEVESPPVAAAPAEIKQLVLDLLTKAREGASIKMKLVYTVLIALANTLLDTFWDQLFTEALQVDPATITFGSTDDTADYSVTKDEEKQLKAVEQAPTEVASKMLSA